MAPHLKDLVSFLQRLIERVQEMGPILKPAAIAIGGLITALTAAKVATLLWNAVLAINPFVALAVAIIAIGVVIYKFRDEILGAFKWLWQKLKDLWEGPWAYAISALLLGPIGVAVVAIIKHRDEIIGAFKVVVDKVTGAFGAVKNFFTGGGGGMADASANLAERVATGWDPVAERTAEVTRRMRRLNVAETAGMSVDVVSIAGLMREGVKSEVSAMSGDVLGYMSDMRRNAAGDLEGMHVDAVETWAAMRVTTDAAWTGFAEAYGNMSAQMIGASKTRRAALLDDLVAEVDGTCAATEAMSACQQRLADDWSLYGAQAIASNQALDSNTRAVRNRLAEYGRTAVDAAKDIDTMSDSAAELAEVVGDLALPISGTMGEIQSAVSNAARVLGLDVDAMNEQFATVPAVADAAAVATGEALARLALALGLTVEQVRGHLGDLRSASGGLGETGSGGRYINAPLAALSTIPASVWAEHERQRTFGVGAFAGQAPQHGGPLPPRLPGLAAGGVVTRPTLALIGEQGPEAVVPLRDYGSGPTTLVANLFLDRERLGRFVIERVNEGVRRGEINVEASLT